MADGLYHKYDVRKADTGHAVEDCFVLRPDRDPSARIALLAYAHATEDLRLRGDLRRWVQGVYDAMPDRTEALRQQLAEAMVADAAHDVEETRGALEKAEWSLDYAREARERVVAALSQEKS